MDNIKKYIERINENKHKVIRLGYINYYLSLTSIIISSNIFIRNILYGFYDKAGISFILILLNAFIKFFSRISIYNNFINFTKKKYKNYSKLKQLKEIVFTMEYCHTIQIGFSMFISFLLMITSFIAILL